MTAGGSGSRSPLELRSKFMAVQSLEAILEQTSPPNSHLDQSSSPQGLSPLGCMVIGSWLLPLQKIQRVRTQDLSCRLL